MLKLILVAISLLSVSPGASLSSHPCTSTTECDDGNACTVDRCHVDTGTCVHAPMGDCP